MKRYKKYFWTEVGFTIFGAVYLAWAFYVGSWWMAAIGGFMFGAHATVAFLWRRKIREYRKATENSGSTGPGSSTGFTFNYATFTSITSRASEPLGTSTGLEVVSGDEPFKGYKWALVPLYMPTKEGKVTFQPMNNSHPKYSVVDTAKCAYGPDFHRGYSSPYSGCGCGFYGTDTIEGAVDNLYPMYKFYADPMGRLSLLEVEFYGTVLVHERGYRAEKQRVLSINVLTNEMHKPIPTCETEWRWVSLQDLTKGSTDG